jgi:cyclopropane fatty-acyl-phospholipid synthase-like methyltransferase
VKVSIRKKDIVSYYEYHQKFYNFFWTGKDNLAMHYGFWDKRTKSLNEALINTNRFLASKARLKSSDIVLDAGCGVGGSAIWLAKKYRTKVVGITISRTQVLQAKKNAKENKVDHLVRFYERDFTKTRFNDGSFNVVWAIESVCHAKDKRRFLKEAYRLLKKGGRLVAADAFLKKNNMTPEEQKIALTFMKGLAVPSAIHAEEFKDYLKRLNYKNIKFFDKTREVMPSSKRLYVMCRLASPFALIFEKLKIIDKMLRNNIAAGIVQYEGLKKDIASYGVFYAER